MTIQIIIIIICCIYLMYISKNNKIEYLAFFLTPFLQNKYTNSILIYIYVLVILKNIIKQIRYKKFSFYKEYLFCLIFVLIILIESLFQDISISYYIGVRNLLFYMFSSYYVIINLNEVKLINKVVIFQTLIIFILGLIEYISLNHRITVFFDNSNYLAFYIIVLSVITVYNKITKLIFFLQCIIVILTGAEACMLILLYISIIQIINSLKINAKSLHEMKKKINHIIYIGTIVFFMFLFNILYLNPYLIYSFISSQSDRTQLWALYSRLFYENNLLIGVGFNEEMNYYISNIGMMPVFDRFGIMYQTFGEMPTHNELYKIIVGTGVIGLIVFYAGMYFLQKKVNKIVEMPNVVIIVLFFSCTHNAIFVFEFWLLLFLPLLKKEVFKEISIRL